MWPFYHVVHIFYRCAIFIFLSQFPSNSFIWFCCVKWTMCFKRLGLHNYVLDGNGSPVCTIGSIRSFHTLLLQLPDKDQAPEPPDVIKKATHHMSMYGTVGLSLTGLPRYSWHVMALCSRNQRTCRTRCARPVSLREATLRIWSNSPLFIPGNRLLFCL